MSENQFNVEVSLNKQLFNAAKAGDLQALNQSIESGANVTYKDEQGVTALMVAAEEGHAEVVAALLEAGAPWNQQVSCLLQHTL